MLRLDLTPDQQTELVRLRDTAPAPYLRERAGALLKIADGSSASAVARAGLLRQRASPTVRTWMHRYQAEGVAGLKIRPGRGRKPAFPPSARHRRGGQADPAAPAAPCPHDLWR